MDCSIIPSRYPDLFQVSTTDFFFPLVEDPYMQGKIACANVLSDLYALGVVECDNMLMLLGASDAFTEKEKDVMLAEMMRGFSDLAEEGGTKVTGGQTVINSWPLIGGVAMAVTMEKDMIRPGGGRAGDVLVLTKPLGTQVAVNLHQWLLDPRWWDKVKDHTSVADVIVAYEKAETSMSRLNRTGAQLMHQYGAHGGTDVTGFGLLGHAQNLAEHQTDDVDIVIHTLPIIAGMVRMDEVLNDMFKLKQGYSAETSGGLLVMLPSEEAAIAFCKEIEARDGQPAWVIGRVVPGSKTARFAPDYKVLEV